MEDNGTVKERYLKLNFFKKVWYSIIKFEKYPEMAALGVKKSLIYFTELILIFSIVVSATYIYYIMNIAQFSDKDLTLSEKIVTELIDVDEYENNDRVTTALEIIRQYPSEVMIFTLFISVFISLYFTTLIDIFTLSVFGLLTCFIARIKMNYKAVFNMSIFALTLAIILRMIYFVITVLTSFEIKYFEIMYIAVAYISLAAAIFMIKSDIVKQQLQLMKIIEESKKKIEDTITIPKKPKEDKKEEDKEDSEEENKDDESQEQGSNA